MRITALIMAGGSGERFWPESRKNLPKQFISLTRDNQTMIQKTVERISQLIGYDNIFVVTGSRYEELTKRQLPQLPDENVIIEPSKKNTAPCIALGAATIKKRYGNSVMVVLPSDHLIKDNEMFIRNLRTVCDFASKNEALMTIGIIPEYPETGYGYIDCGDCAEGEIYHVRAFKEKPDKDLALRYVKEGHFLWNSGIFVWQTDVILSCIKELLPDISEKIARMQNKDFQERQEIFNSIEGISIDYGIMEKVSNVYTVRGYFGWNDVGTWDAYGLVNDKDTSGNVINGNVIDVECHDSIVKAEDKLVVAVGLERIVVVDTEDALLVCDRSRCQDIKQALEIIKEKGEGDVL